MNAMLCTLDKSDRESSPVQYACYIIFFVNISAQEAPYALYRNMVLGH